MNQAWTLVDVIKNCVPSSIESPIIESPNNWSDDRAIPIPYQLSPQAYTKIQH